jgi:hypothetical protein
MGKASLVKKPKFSKNSFTKHFSMLSHRPKRVGHVHMLLKSPTPGKNFKRFSLAFDDVSLFDTTRHCDS